MRAKDLNLSEIIQFSPGFIGFQGRRLLIHDLSSLGQIRKDLIDSVGNQVARKILTRKGLFWGQADAAGMKRLYNWDNTTEWLKAGPELAKMSGMAYIEISKCAFTDQSNKLTMEITCADSAEVEQHRNEFGKADTPVCWVTAGYMSGYASYCIDTPVYFVETKCQGMESSNCILVGKDEHSWGEEIKIERSYFFAPDISNKIQQLTKRIKDQQKQKDFHLKQLNAVKKEYSLFGVEIYSKSFQNIVEFANRVASFDTTVLITGETGTGKEVIARHIHFSSPRKNHPFVAVNCSALPDTLLENELFGHASGAFTGAKSNKTGLIESAEKGTLFLDEIGDISPALQVKLLRVLQSKEIRPVGSTKNKIIDVRVCAATNRDLEQLVKEKKFREDLLYRLQVIQIALPPLRERIDDILPLARHFLSNLEQKFKISNLRFSPETLDLLNHYYWPGNVRELENALERAVVLCNDGLITPKLLPLAINNNADHTSLKGTTTKLGHIELQHIQRILHLTSGNRLKAADLLGISESTLYRRLRETQSGLSD